LTKKKEINNGKDIYVNPIFKIRYNSSSFEFGFQFDKNQFNNQLKNRYGQALASLSRGIGPVSGGLLWTFSTSNSFHFLPLNFIIISGILILSQLIAIIWFDESLETQKEEEHDVMVEDIEEVTDIENQ